MYARSKKRSAPRSGPASYKRAKILQPRTSLKVRQPTAEVKTVLSEAFNLPVTAKNYYTSYFGNVPVGTDDHERIGKVIKHQDFDVSYGLSSASGTACSNVRVIIGVARGRSFDTIHSNPQLILAEFETTLTNADAVDNVIRPYEYTNSKNITILYDKLHNFQPDSGAGNPVVPSFTEVMFQCPTIKYVAQQEYYDDTSASNSNYQHFIMFVNGPNSQVAVRYIAQARFIDQ
uniref:Uncharacterized protein n=1 Tax=uncultured prokaryote TaxID=198431 RepID=A0A0H5Q7W2_9ZZZZ|nr:hypothetical protein [uncultured prokaryote]